MRAIMNICVSSLACLSFSLRPPPPSPRLLSSSVVFEMLRGSLNSVSVSGCDAATKKCPPPCPGAFLVSLRPEGTITHIYAAPGRLQFLDYVTESLRPEQQVASTISRTVLQIWLKFTG